MTLTLTVGGLVWSNVNTSALMLVDGSDLTATTPLRRSEVTVPRRRGVQVFDAYEDRRTDELSVAVFGDYDTAGAATVGSQIDQLLANLKAIRATLAHSHLAEVVASFTFDGDTYEADVRAQLSGTVGPAHVFRGRLALDVHGGAWRKTADNYISADSASTRTFTVTNDGTLDVYDAIVELSGSATAVTLTNQTYGNASVTFTGSLGTLTTLTTGDKDADRDGSAVHGLVTHSGHDAWLPLAAGDNTVEVAPTGGTAAVDVAVRPTW